MRAFSVTLAYLGLFGGLAILLSWLPWWERVDIDGFTAAQEETLGEYVRRSLLESGTAVSNDTLDAAIQEILARLTQKLDGQPVYEVYVIRDSTVNAFALPGRILVFHTGLIAFADSPEEFAAVMAHEIAHSEKGHIMNKLMKEIGLELLFSTLGGGNTAVIREAGKVLISTGYDRSLESEADAYGQELLELAEIDPDAMASFFGRLMEVEGREPGGVEFLSTHPNHDRRQSAARAYRPAPGFHAKPLNVADWALVKKSLSE